MAIVTARSAVDDGPEVQLPVVPCQEQIILSQSMRIIRSCQWEQAVDFLLVISGTLMGGIFGVGTIVSALITGILVARFAKLIDRIQLRKINWEDHREQKIRRDTVSEKL